MGLVNIYTPDPGPDGWQLFWWHNWNEHLSIMQAILAQKNITLQSYGINPWIPEDKDNILSRHQQFHNDMNLVMGVQGENLAVLEIDDPQAVKQWVWQHYNEHLGVQTLLKIG